LIISSFQNNIEHFHRSNFLCLFLCGCFCFGKETPKLSPPLQKSVSEVVLLNPPEKIKDCMIVKNNESYVTHQRVGRHRKSHFYTMLLKLTNWVDAGCRSFNNAIRSLKNVLQCQLIIKLSAAQFPKPINI